MTAPSLTVILPTFNERDNVIELINRIMVLPESGRFSILVMDDDSEDDTAGLVEKVFANEGRISVIRRVGKKRGLVESLNEGIRIARSDIILWMDADLQMPPEKISSFIREMQSGNYTAVIGSRFIPGGADEREVSGRHLSALHKFLSLFLNNVVPRLLELPYTDITSGFIAIKRDFFRNVSLQGNHGEYFMRLVYQLHHEGHLTKEIPYQLTHRQYGSSKSTGGSFCHLVCNGLPYLLTFARLYVRGSLQVQCDPAR